MIHDDEWNAADWAEEWSEEGIAVRDADGKLRIVWAKDEDRNLWFAFADDEQPEDND